MAEGMLLDPSICLHNNIKNSCVKEEEVISYQWKCQWMTVEGECIRIIP